MERYFHSLVEISFFSPKVLINQKIIPMKKPMARATKKTFGFSAQIVQKLLSLYFISAKFLVPLVKIEKKTIKRPAKIGIIHLYFFIFLF